MANRKLLIPLLIAAFLDSPLAAQSSAPVTLNFDSVSTSAAPYSVDATAYLASNGITLSGVTAGTRVVIVNDFGYYDGEAVHAPSAPNTLTQMGSNAPVSFTLMFAAPLRSLAFKRSSLIAGRNGITHPSWTAVALDAAGNTIGVPVGEGYFGSFATVPAASFTLDGPGIASVRVSSQNLGSAFSAVVLDDFVLAVGSSRHRAVTPPPADASKTLLVRAAAGATLTLLGGRIRLTIPAGSLTTDQTVTASSASLPDSENGAFGPVGLAASILFETARPLGGPITIDMAADAIDADNAAPFAYIPGGDCTPGCYVAMDGSIDTATKRATLTIVPAIVNAAATGTVSAAAVDPIPASFRVGHLSARSTCGSTNGLKVWIEDHFASVEVDPGCSRLPFGLVPGKKTLLLIAGMFSSVERAFATCGSGAGALPDFTKRYDQVIGFNYDWTQHLDDSGKLLAPILECLASHIPDLDVAAHSEGVPVLLSGAGLAATAPIKNIYSLGGPLDGTPIAQSKTALTIGTYLKDVCIPGDSVRDIVHGGFRTDLLEHSIALAEIRDRFNRRPQHPDVWAVAGNEPIAGVQTALSKLGVQIAGAFDGMITVPSALGLNVTLANLHQVGAFTVTHTDLECSAAVNDALRLPPEVVTLTASPSTILNGQSSTLHWATFYATSVSISGVGETLSPTGSTLVLPAQTTSYTLTAFGPAGTATRTVTVTVTVNVPAPIIQSFTSSAASVTAGQPVTLIWTTTNTTSVSISGVSDPLPASGSRSVTPAATTTYTLTATGPGGTAAATLTVIVQQPSGGGPLTGTWLGTNYVRTIFGFGTETNRLTWVLTQSGTAVSGTYVRTSTACDGFCSDPVGTTTHGDLVQGMVSGSTLTIFTDGGTPFHCTVGSSTMPCTNSGGLPGTVTLVRQ